jgi:hypothetical protein
MNNGSAQKTMRIIIVHCRDADESQNANQRVGKNQLIVDLDNSVCHNGGKFQKHCPRKTMTRVPRLIHSPDLSPCDFRLFGYAKEQMKGQMITNKDDLEEKLSDVREKVRGDLYQSVLYDLSLCLSLTIRYLSTPSGESHVATIRIAESVLFAKIHNGSLS